MEKTLSPKALPFFSPTRLLWFILFVGIVLRIQRYLFNRSLWLDEAALALNIVNRSFLELLGPLDHNQGAPISFLMIQRALVQILGNSEYVLRLFPLITGILSLFLLCRVAQHFLDPKAVPVVLGLFAISEPLIYYSSEVKQYSSDVAFTVLLYWVASKFRSKELTIRNTVLFGLIGAIVIWNSHPSVFVLAGIGGTIGLFTFMRKDWKKLSRLFMVFLFWLASFSSNYFISLNQLKNNEALLGYWGDAFIPIEPLLFVKWFHTNSFRLFVDPVGSPLLGIATLAF